MKALACRVHVTWCHLCAWLSAKPRVTLMIAAALTTAMSLNVAAQTPSGERAVIEIVRLQHRDPAPIRQAIEPLLDERGAISQIDNNLVISTTRSNLTELQELISELDVPRRQLRVSVDFRYGRPAAAISSPGADGSSVTTVATQDSTDYPMQSIVLSEGEFAYFSLVNSTPRTGLRFTELGAVLSQDTSQTASSLAVGAELRGSRAVLTIAAAQRQPAFGSVESSVVNSSLEVDFNTWQIVSSTAGNPSVVSTVSTVSAQPQVLATTNAPEAVAVRVELLP